MVRIPKGATSDTRPSMNPSTPNLEAAYAVRKSPVEAIPAVEEIVTTRPERWDRSCGSAARVTLTGPNSVVSTWDRNASGVISSKNPAWKLPALLTTTSRCPKRSTAADTAARACSGEVTSRATASRPSCSPSAVVMLPTLRAVATTAWPASRAALAMSTPRPRPAPVTNHTSCSTT